MSLKDHDGEANLSPSHSRHRDSMSDDPEFEGLTKYEKKALLVDRELDSQGMGKYQWCIFILCGFGYFLDLLWAQAFGLILAFIQQEFGFGDDALGNLGSAGSAGLTAGAFVWGFLVDIIGRYWAFNFTILWSSIFGLALGASNSYGVLIVLATFQSFGIGGNIPIDTTICLECLPHNRRWLLPTLSLFQPLGVICCSLLALAFIPHNSCAADLMSCNVTSPGEACCGKHNNYGWRYLMYTLGCITLTFFILRFFCFRFQESPKYLAYRGRDAEAIKSLSYIARFNGKQCNLTLETLSGIPDDKPSEDSLSLTTTNSRPLTTNANASTKKSAMSKMFKSELERYKLFFIDRQTTQLVLLLWLIYAFDYWGFSISGTFLPLIIKRKGSELGLSLTETYRSYVYIFLFGIPGVLLGASIYTYKRLSLIVSSATFAACLFAFTTVSSEGSYIGVSGLVYFFQSMFNALLYGMTPEFFPAPIRGTACGVASFWGRIFSIVAPIAGSHVLAKSANGDGVLYLAGGGVFVCTVAIIFIPGKFMKTSKF